VALKHLFLIVKSSPYSILLFLLIFLYSLREKYKEGEEIMQDFIQSMKMAMELKGFAKSTQRTYLAHLKRYADFW